MPETLLSVSEVLLFGRLVKDLEFKGPEVGGQRVGVGPRHQLYDQIKDGKIARIYGFSYEGSYYELPSPTLFLVHGEGTSATAKNAPGDHASRAPTEPSDSGVAAADFQYADDILYWNYDKCDMSIRLDVSTGFLEDILLAEYFSGGPGVAGAKVSGAKVSGAKVSGAKVSGAKVSGAKAWGPGD